MKPRTLIFFFALLFSFALFSVSTSSVSAQELCNPEDAGKIGAEGGCSASNHICNQITGFEGGTVRTFYACLAPTGNANPISCGDAGTVGKRGLEGGCGSNRVCTAVLNPNAPINNPLSGIEYTCPSNVCGGNIQGRPTRCTTANTVPGADVPKNLVDIRGVAPFTYVVGCNTGEECIFEDVLPPECGSVQYRGSTPSCKSVAAECMIKVPEQGWSCPFANDCFIPSPSCGTAINGRQTTCVEGPTFNANRGTMKSVSGEDIAQCGLATTGCPPAQFCVYVDTMPKHLRPDQTPESGTISSGSTSVATGFSAIEEEAFGVGFNFGGSSDVADLFDTQGDDGFTLLDWIFFISGILLMLYLLLGGFRLMTSVGDPKAAGAARQIITNAIIGFVIVFVAFWIVQIAGIFLGLPQLTSIFGP